MALNSQHIPRELFLSSRISAEEYLIAIKKISIFGGFFMVIGFVLIDYFVLPRFFRNYEAFGFFWSATIAIIISLLSFLINYRMAKRIIDKQGMKSKTGNNSKIV
jgi:hypothetical protein